VSFMPPDPSQGAPTQEMPAVNGGPPEQPGDLIADAVDAAGHAFLAAAQACAVSEDPDACVKYSQAGFYWAQAIEKIAALDPSRAQPDPTQQLKTQADMVKTGAQMAHDQSKAEMQHQHDLAKAELQAKAKPEKPAPKRR
jgi:hypothetical protein